MATKPITQEERFADGWWTVSMNPLTAVKHHGAKKPEDSEVPEGCELRYSLSGFWWKMSPSYENLILYGCAPKGK